MKIVVTNVRLEAPMFRSLKLRALERGVPAAVLIREAIARYLEDAPLPYDWETERAELLKLCGIGRSGKPGSTGSTDIDAVLYGARPRRKGR